MEDILDGLEILVFSTNDSLRREETTEKEEGILDELEPSVFKMLTRTPSGEDVDDFASEWPESNTVPEQDVDISFVDSINPEEHGLLLGGLLVVND